jgi:hypothetical protein
MRFATPLLLVAAAAGVITLVEGTPDRLPGVALGSSALLHVIRAGALFAIVVAVASVLREGARGRLPTQLTTSGLAYESEAAAEAKDVAETLQEQVDDLQRQISDLVELAVGDEEPRG